ncbi:unnamed protein product [Lathyrus oleraceus]
MAKIHMFIYAMIIFLSLSLVAAEHFPLEHECRIDQDCTRVVEYPLVMRCIGYRCVVINTNDVAPKPKGMHKFYEGNK